MDWQQVGNEQAWQAWTREALYTVVWRDGMWRALRGQEELGAVANGGRTPFAGRVGWLTRAPAMQRCEQEHRCQRDYPDDYWLTEPEAEWRAAAISFKRVEGYWPDGGKDE